MKLPDCHSRREIEPGGKTFYCVHPQMNVPGNLVRAEICRLCHYWKGPPPAEPRPYPPPVTPGPLRGECFHLGEQTGLRECSTCQGNVRLKVFECRHPLHRETTRDECRACLDHDDRLSPGGVRTWAVGVTTAPREQPTLERTLASLAAAGWPEPRLFAEPDVEVPDAFAHLPLSCRNVPLGAWPNFFLGLSELVLREPQADAYFLLQDDVVLCRDLRDYLEQTLWPAETLALVSPYCPSFYVRRTRGWHVVDVGWNLVGALTCVLPNAAARSLLGFARAVSFRQRGPYNGLKNVDSVLGHWAQHQKLPVLFHTPSLAQHIGQTSVVWPHAPISGRRQASDFVGESFDSRELAHTKRCDDLPLPPGEGWGGGRNGTLQPEP